MLNVTKSKQDLREELLIKRKKIGRDVVLSRSKNMYTFFSNWDFYIQAKTVMFFLSMADEPQLQEFFENAWALGKNVCVPYLQKTYGIMDAAVISDFNGLIRGRLGLLVPHPEKLELMDPRAINLIVVPAVAYDRFGNRLGMGAGYYDRFLPQALNATLIGACWQSHILDHIPTDVHDKRVHYLLTEEGLIQCSD